MKADPSYPHTLSSPTSPNSNQSLPKSVSAPAQKEFQNFSPPSLKKKIKTLQRSTDPDKNDKNDRNESNDKFNMKGQFDQNTRTDKNRQCITGGIFYCRDSGYFSVFASNKLSCNLTGQCFEIGNKNIPPNRYASL